MTPAVELRKITKSYGGLRALADVSARFEPGRVTAVLGPNGAGKSTLLGILATLIKPTSGTLTPLDRAQIGYVGHEPGLYGDLDAHANLRLFSDLYGLRDPETRAEAALERAGLARADWYRPARAFSRGMTQRLALARALLHEPDVLLFDEPASALDPAGAAWLETVLRAERARGRVVVLVTHDLEAAAAVADSALVFRRGRVQREATPAAGGFGPGELRALYAEATGAA